MATPVKSDNPAVLCTSTKEDLLKGDVLKVWDNCPICCDDYGILCRVACHPSTVLMLTTDDVVTVLITVHCTYIQCILYTVRTKYSIHSTGTVIPLQHYRSSY